MSVSQLFLQDYYTVSGAEVTLRKCPARSKVPTISFDKRGWRIPGWIDVVVVFFVAILRLGEDLYLLGTFGVGMMFWGLYVSPSCQILSDVLGLSVPAVVVAVITSFVVSVSWGFWVPFLLTQRRWCSYIWLVTADGHRSSIAGLSAIKHLCVDIDDKKKQVDALALQCSRADPDVDRPKELDDISALMHERAAKKKSTLQAQIDSLHLEIRQLAAQSQQLVHLAGACAILMEELKVAGLGGSYMELPHEDPLPFMERFIADGKAKLKAKYELDAMDEPQEAQNG